MVNTTIRCTDHAARRQAQRNLSDEDIQFVWECGRRVRCAGALHIFLGRRDIPPHKKIYQRFAHLEGTVLVINDTQGEEVLLTAYRNKHGLKQIRTKSKFNRSATVDEGRIQYQ
jgi:hypothetical protein